MIEREVKFQVGDGFELPALDGVLDGLIEGAVVGDEAERRTVDDTYHDTDDLRLLRWGCTLRYRDGAGWNVKLPRGTRGSALVRNEVTVHGPADEPPLEALDLVSPFTRGRPLAVIATVATSRTARVWTGPDGRPLVELVDDSTTGTRVLADDAVTTTFRQIEVELMPDSDESVLDAFVDALEAAGARPDPTAIKVVRALGSPELDPPDVVVEALGDEPTARDVIRWAVARSVVQLFTELPGAVLGQDPEGVHQARVATRRLRSDLRTFRRLLDRTWADELDGHLRTLAADLGAVRDADVLGDLIRRVADDTPRIDEAGPVSILDLLSEQRRHHLDALRARLRQESTHQLFDRLVEAAAEPATTAGADRPATDALPALVARRWRRLVKAVDRLGPTPAAEGLHEVRILVKRTRYAAEAVAPAFGRPSRRFARALARMQDDLGDRNDLAVAERWLTEHAEQLPPVGAFAAGRLAELMGQELRTSGGDGDWRADFETAARPGRSGWLA